MDIYSELKNVDKQMSIIILDAAENDVHLATRLQTEKLQKLQGLQELLINTEKNGGISMPFEMLVKLLAGVTFADFADTAEELQALFKDIRYLDRCHDKELNQ